MPYVFYVLGYMQINILPRYRANFSRQSRIIRDDYSVEIPVVARSMRIYRKRHSTALFIVVFVLRVETKRGPPVAHRE